MEPVVKSVYSDALSSSFRSQKLLQPYSNKHDNTPHTRLPETMVYADIDLNSPQI